MKGQPQRARGTCGPCHAGRGLGIASLALALPGASCGREPGEPAKPIAAIKAAPSPAASPDLSPTREQDSPPQAPPSLASPTAPRPPFANLDPSDDGAFGPPEELPDCEARLASEGIRFRPASLPLHVDRASRITCGARQVVTYVRGPGRIAYDPAPLLTCQMALALASYEGILQEEAERVFGRPVVRIEQLGTYSCRAIGRFRGTVSEHAYANALDVARFVLEDGKVVSVSRDFDASEGLPARPGGDFLRAVSQRGQDEGVFSNVLTPFWDAAHRDHFHLDLARYRVEGTRPASAPGPRPDRGRVGGAP